MQIENDTRDNMKTYNAYVHKSKVFMGEDED